MEVESTKFWLPKPILEARRDGVYYPPITLYIICTGLSAIERSG